MAYGTVKVDNITFDNGGSDQNVTVSGLYRATTSGVTLSGTIAATTVSGVTIIGSTTVSGATVTGTTANFTSGNFSNIISSAATMSGALIIANQQQVQFREAVSNGVNHIALQAPAIVSADQTITLPDQTGTVVTTGDNGSVTSTMILAGTILNSNINASAGIVDTKLATIATAGKVSNSATTATNANTASAIVARDASGNFTAGTITAALTGAASSNVLKAGDTMTGVLAVTAGTAALPGLAIASDLNTGIYSPGADQLAVSTGGTGRLFVDSSGRVGIGTSSPAGRLSIRSDRATEAYAAVIGTNNGVTFENDFVFGFNGAVQSVGNFQSFPLAFLTNNTERLRITSAGSVGIGTSSPAERLDVQGSIVTRDGGSIQWRGSGGGTNQKIWDAYSVNNTANSLFFRCLDDTYTNSNPWLSVTRSGNQPQVISFFTGASERARIDSSGRVGIGTNSPGRVLHAVSTAGTVARFESTNTTASVIDFKDANTTADFRVQVGAIGDNLGLWAGGTERARIDSSGRLGLGTSSPATLLQLVQASAGTVGTFNVASSTGGGSEIRVANGYSSTVPIYSFWFNNTTGIGNPAVNEISAIIAGTERARIDSSGRLLVGASAYRSTGDVFTPNAMFYSEGTGTGHYQVLVGVTNRSTDTQGTQIALGRSRGSANGAVTIVQNNDMLGEITFAGADGVDLHSRAAHIRCEVDGTPGVNDMPGRLVFSTTADGFASSAERMRITSAGNVGIGTTSPDYTLNVQGTVGVGKIGANGTYNLFWAPNTAGQSVRWIRNNSGELAIGEGITAGTNEHLRIDASGRLLVGTSSARSNYSAYGAALLQAEGANNDGARAFSFTYGKADAGDPIISLGKHRSNSVGGVTVVNDGDGIGQVVFAGSDGTNFVTGATIRAQVDGTPGTNDMPGRLVFATTADGAASPTERLRITSAGVLQVADASNITVGTTTGTKIGTATTQKLGFFDKTPVVQPTAVADATDAASVITQLNALLTRMRNLGLIAT